MYTELCLEWPNKMTDKLPREIHVKQLLVDSMLYFSFDRPVTEPYFSFEKKCTRLKKYHERLRAVPTWFQQRRKWFKNILILMSTKKTHSVSLNTHRVQSECLLPESTNQEFLKRLRYRWVGSKNDQTGLIQRLWLTEWNVTRLLDWLMDQFESHYMLKLFCLMYS